MAYYAIRVERALSLAYVSRQDASLREVAIQTFPVQLGALSVALTCRKQLQLIGCLPIQFNKVNQQRGL